MKSLILSLLLMASNALSALITKHAPDFTLKDQDNKVIKLSELKGNYVVLEWLNHGCPFVKKHYNSQNMQKTQEFALNSVKNVKWLSVISSAKGKQGHSTPTEALKDKKDKGSKASHILIDESGKVGKAYGAKTTPHLFVIDPKGIVIYEGAIDSIASADSSDIPKANNHIKDIFTKLKAGKDVQAFKTRPYGCSVKY